MFFHKEIIPPAVIQATENFESANSDFDFYAQSGGTTELVSHSNSSLNLTINPLSNGGTTCRKFTENVQKMYYKTDVYDGAFYNVPNTKSLSLRACLRRNGASPSDILISAKDSSALTDNFTLGYKFGIGNNRLMFYAGTNLIVQSPNGLPTNVWLSLRMDITSLSATSDSVKCYVESSPGSGVWSTSYDGVVWEFTCTSANGRFVNWSNNGRNGIFTSGGGPIYVDNIDFQSTNA